MAVDNDYPSQHVGGHAVVELLDYCYFCAAAAGAASALTAALGSSVSVATNLG